VPPWRVLGQLYEQSEAYTGPKSAPLDLLFANTNDSLVSISDYPIVAPDKYHPPLNFDFKLTLHCQPTFLVPQRNYGQGDYLLLYNTLSNYD
jgi:hypothetical protein